MDIYQTVFELIDMRSFSNLWFWIALAVVWSSASHWILGVPYDMVIRARRSGGQAMQDLEDVARININRIVYISEVSGVILFGFVCFLLSVLAILAFWYWVEFAQAVFLLAFPMSIVGFISVRRAVRIRAENPESERLCRHLQHHRFWVQVIGMIAILVTAMFGMYQNFVGHAPWS